MTNGLIEYVVVTTTGKLHESLLKTEAQPQDLHVAMLLLGAKGAPPATPVTTNSVPGEKISIEVRPENGASQPIEEYVIDLKANKSMTRGPWIYNGSRVIDGTFIAQRDGSIVSLITDPDALVNNPRVRREDDENWHVNTNKVLRVNTPVEVTFKLLNSTNTAAAAAAQK
jgi:hypothetical protein